jgi:hypothetical protein
VQLLHTCLLNSHSRCRDWFFNYRLRSGISYPKKRKRKRSNFMEKEQGPTIHQNDSPPCPSMRSPRPEKKKKERGGGKMKKKKFPRERRKKKRKKKERNLAIHEVGGYDGKESVRELQQLLICSQPMPCASWFQPMPYCST